MLIKEVILENFMSYEYARIPLKPGLNIICGPNGVGKSSILLGISVALGQSYTERSRRLSDLIRRGKDQGRCTLILDNSRRNGRRPVPRINRDTIMLTRFLRRDGKYWFEIEGNASTKADVLRLLSKFGVDPENMLIIMHQNMVEQFIVLSPQEKLRLVESAIGLEEYRRNVLSAQRKLGRIMSQKDSINRLLESAEQTLNYWREQYDRYQEKKQLKIKRRFLERELAWCRVNELDNRISELSRRLDEGKRDYDELTRESAEIEDALKKLESHRQELLRRREEQFRSILELERVFTEKDVRLKWTVKEIAEIEGWLNSLKKEIEQKPALSDFGRPLNGGGSGDLIGLVRELEAKYENLAQRVSGLFNLRLEALRRERSSLEGVVKEAYNSLNLELKNMEALNSEIEGVYEDIIKNRIDLTLLNYEAKSLDRNLKELVKQINELKSEHSKLMSEAEALGPRLVTFRTEEQILSELRLTDGHLLALADVSEDIERMYESYSKLYLELKEKAAKIEENRLKALEEVNERMKVWRNVLQDILEKVNLRFQSILSNANADGMVKLTNAEDIENAGLELHVGFRGNELVPLNMYTQSGGEKSTAVMSFLIALQQHVRSPFRAVDEYDIHMDPKNRELMAELLLSVIEGTNVQYIVITPSQLNFKIEGAHVITVQSVGGSSVVSELIQN